MAAPTQRGSSNQKKIAHFSKTKNLFSSHSNIIIVEADNVGSSQLAQIRYALRGKAVLLMGKNTMIKACMKSILNDVPKIFNLMDYIKENVGLIFCFDDLSDIKKIVSEFKTPAPAKQNIIAPNDVKIPAGPTGMDPGQTSFFQSLNIPTKIVKGQVEIINEVNLITAGDKVTPSQSVLLTKLNIKPFTYGLKCTNIYEEGTIYPASVLDLTVEEVTESIEKAVASVSLFSVGAGIPNELSVPHVLRTAFRQIANFSFGIDMIFPEIECFRTTVPVMKQDIVDNVVEEAKETEKLEVEEEDDGDMGFSLFD